MDFYSIFFIIVFYTAIITPSQSVLLNLTSTIECPPELGLANPLTGNIDGVQELLDYCKEIPRCKDLYGQRNGDKLALFEAVVQITTEFNPPLFVETPIINYVCNTNPTLLELNALIWGVILERDYLGSSQACSLDQEPGKALIDPEGESTSFTCRACPDCDVQSDGDLNLLYIVFATIFLFLLAIFAAVQVWKLSVEERKLRYKELNFNDNGGLIIQ